MRRKREILPPGTLAVIIISVLMYAACMLVPFSGSDSEKLILFGAFYKPFILAGEYWRLITAGFLHGSVIHIFFNLYAVSVIGRLLEHRFGTWKYLLILLGSNVGGYLFLFAMKGNRMAVGLSGGLYGLMAAYIIMVIRMGGWKIPAMRSSLIQLVSINLIINFLPGIAYMVHIGGFISGALLTIALDTSEKFKPMRIHAAAAFIIMLVFGIWYGTKNSYIYENERYLGTDLRILTLEKEIGLEGYAKYMARRLDQVYGFNYLEQIIGG